MKWVNNLINAVNKDLVTVSVRVVSRVRRIKSTADVAISEIITGR